MEELRRGMYNEEISKRAWAYVGGLMGLFVLVTGYVLKRKIQINWKYIISENVAMVVLLALYELMFFNTIIYPYEPISTDEIGRNAVEKLQVSCGILTHV
jgi:cytochrome b subunit of formate dehydrogenase